MIDRIIRLVLWLLLSAAIFLDPVWPPTTEYRPRPTHDRKFAVF